MAILCFYGLQGGVLNWEGMKLYPQWRHAYGADAILPHSQHFKADIAIVLTDVWVMEPDLYRQHVPFVPWFPIDHDPIPPPVAVNAQKAWQPIVFTQFAMHKMREAGMNAMYVPHGVDTKKLAPHDRKEARRALGVPDGVFLAGMVAANKGQPARKSFPEILLAWRSFVEKHNDALLYLHTTADQTYGGVLLPQLCQHLGLQIGRHVVFSDQYVTMGGFPPEYMADAYSAMDVLLSPSQGEGFGIPIVEAQSCGCPVIVGDWTSMSELLFAGWHIARQEAHPNWTPLGSWQFAPDPRAIIDRLEKAYAAKDDEVLREAARRGALAYDADVVTEKYWKPCLEQMEARLSAEKGRIAPVEVIKPAVVEDVSSPVDSRKWEAA